MLSENIILQSAGSLSVAVMALLMLILQTLFFFRKPHFKWYAWSAAISFSALLYSVGIFLEYNTPEGPLNRFSGLLEYTAIICLVHCLYGFTFSYLGIESKRYHQIAGVCHGLILILLWSTHYIVSESFTTRDFIGLEFPYIEPALGPLGPVFVLYAALAGVIGMTFWIKHKRTDPKHRIAFLAGLGFWLLLGIHDGLASLGLPALQYFMEYGFLGFAMVVLWVVFNSYLEIAAEEKYRVITEFANDCILVIQDGKMVFGNPACCDLIGAPLTDSEPRDFLDIMPSEDRKTVLEHYNTLLDNGHASNPHSVQIRGTNGEQRFVEIATSLIQYRNRPAVLAIMRDITGRKRAEEDKNRLEDQLQRAQKIEAIGTLAGGIAHDFNNILVVILANCDLAETKLAEDSEAIDNLNQVRNAGNRARMLIKQILAFGRMGEQEMIALSLTPLIKEALKFIRSTLPTSIEIRDYIEADPGIIEADTTQIHQIVMNLCTNAGHALREEGGTLHVRLTRVEVDRQTALQHHELHDGPHVRLTVTDTGCGMDSETLEHIFDPYFTTKEVGEGTGLGLSVVHGIVKTHNGVITVESEPGKGTTFHVYFPVIEKEEKIQEEDEGPLPTGNERILFVDDEQMILDMAEEMLRELGYDVVTKKSSVEALELFRADPDRFDLVITDMTMPKMTGDQLSRELMKVRPDIPIILCTGFNPKISEEKAKEIGIKAFAMKPLVGRDMANIVRKVLDAGRSKV